MKMKTPLPKLSEESSKDGPKLDELLLNDPLVRTLLLPILVDYLRSGEKPDKETDVERPTA